MACLAAVVMVGVTAVAIAIDDHFAGVRPVAPASLSSASTAPPRTTQCNIAATDFSDLAVDSVQFGRIRFKSGLFVSSDDLGNPDWRFTLATSSSVYTVGPETIRMVSIVAEHLSGSGSWYVVQGYICSNNEMKKVMEESSLTPIRMTMSSDNAVQFTVSTIYEGGVSPPLGKKRVTLSWNEQNRQLSIVESN